jgi:ABC-type dipeptide/oligopeptide/nickel transport system ATPase subunit
VSLVALDGIRVEFPAGRRSLKAVDGVSLVIGFGETLALVGESGSGKSTIGNVVAGLQRPTAGTMRFRGKLLDKATQREAQRAIQIVFQDPFGALDPRMPVSAIIAEPLLIQRIGTSSERSARAADLADQVGLPGDALNRYPHEFSGGQRQRIAIARALAAVGAGCVDPKPDPELDVGSATGARVGVSVH